MVRLSGMSQRRDKTLRPRDTGRADPHLHAPVLFHPWKSAGASVTVTAVGDTTVARGTRGGSGGGLCGPPGLGEAVRGAGSRERRPSLRGGDPRPGASPPAPPRLRCGVRCVHLFQPTVFLQRGSLKEAAGQRAAFRPRGRLLLQRRARAHFTRCLELHFFFVKAPLHWLF